MKNILKIALGIFTLVFTVSCQYHYGPEENLNGETPETKARHKSYVKETEPKTRSIEDVEADITALKANLEVITENLDKSDKANAEQLNLIKAEVKQLKMDYHSELTRIYWIFSGVVILIAGTVFFGVSAFVEKRIREDKVSDILS